MGAEPESESSDAPAGTYRTISEEELADLNKKQANSNMVKENGDNCPDGADEKMLNEEKKIAAKTDHADVKFISGDQQNGDTKVDILEIKQAFTGLTKEELMKYANDPFWVRLRWIMFILFWLIWLGMLAGAIYIIIGAPKCSPPPPKKWWEEGPLLDLDDDKSEIAPDKFFKDLESKMPLLDAFKGVFIPEQGRADSDAYSAIMNTTDSSLFKSFAEKAKENKFKLIVDITPNFVQATNEWFVKSESGDSKYKDYFIWADGVTSENNPTEPNNWLTLSDKTAWTYSETRKQFYLHQFDSKTPDLNFRNPEVVKEFDKVIQFWLANGASGVRLSKAAHLLVDEKFANESFAPAGGVTQDKYDFYNHDKTTYRDGLSELLWGWKKIVLDNTENEGLLMMKEDINLIDRLKFNETLVVDLPRVVRTKAKQPSLNRNAEAIKTSINSVFSLLGADAWPSWKYETGKGGLSSELRILTMLLPGTPVMTIDQVSLSENNTTVEDVEYKTLVNIRASPSMKYGTFNSHLLCNGSVYAYTRLKSGNPGFVVVYNPTASVVYANMTVLEDVPSELTVHLLSKNYNVNNVFLKAKLPADNVTVSANSSIILTYAPVSD